MRNSLLLSLFACITCLHIQAQGTAENGAFAAGNGIIIYLSDNTYNEAQPNKKITSIRIERKADNENTYTQIATMQSPGEQAEFERRYNTAMENIPFDLSQLKGKAKAIWEKYNRHKRFDSLGIWGTYLPVQMAFGISYLDKSAKPNTRYTYQLIYMEGSTAGKTVAFTPTSFPKKPVFGKIQYLSGIYTGNAVELKWGGKKGNWPQNLLALRQEKLAGKWERFASVLVRNSGKDSNFVQVRDTSALQKRVYRYALVPSDAYGNPGDTIFSNYIGAYNYIQVAPPFRQIKAGLTTDKKAITISWIIEDASLVSAVRIYKSPDREGKYDTLATVPANTITYVDQYTNQLKMTHYYLQCVGPLGETGPPGPRFFALPDQEYAPIAPTLITATPAAKGIELLIQNNDKYAAGFRVYRQEENDMPMLPITDLLPFKQNSFTYTDTSSLLSGKISYGYCVKAESPGYDLSPASDTLFVKPLKTTIPPLPTGLAAKRDEGVVKLFWDNMALSDESVATYRVFRRELPEGKWTGINDSLLTGDQNNFEDRNILVGKKYAYSVECYDYYGGKSGLGMAIEVSIPLSPIEPAAGTRGYKVASGIQLSCDMTLQNDLKSYNLYRYQRGQAPKKIATIPAGNIIQYFDTQVTAGQLYFYYFTTTATDGRESLPGEEVSVRY